MLLPPSHLEHFFEISHLECSFACACLTGAGAEGVTQPEFPTSAALRTENLKPRGVYIPGPGPVPRRQDPLVAALSGGCVPAAAPAPAPGPASSLGTGDGGMLSNPSPLGVSRPDSGSFWAGWDHVVHDVQREPEKRDEQVSLRLGPAARPPGQHAGAAAAAGGAGSRPGQEHGELPAHARPLPGQLHRPVHRHEVPVRAGLGGGRRRSPGRGRGCERDAAQETG